MRVSPDKFRGASLLKNGEDIFSSISSVPNATPRFFILNYYAALIEFLEALAAIRGERLRGPDHHRDLLEFLARQSICPPNEIALLDNLRRIRNDIQYQGSKSDEGIASFVGFNRKNIIKAISAVKAEVKREV